MRIVPSPLDILQKLKADKTLRDDLASLGAGAILAQLEQRLDKTPAIEPWLSSQSALQAALCVTFVASELSGDVDAVDQVLQHASLQTVDGLARLKLDEQTRAAVLTIAVRNDELKTALQLSAEADEKLLAEQGMNAIALDSAWLRQFLRGRTVELHRYALPQLSAANRARAALSMFDAMPEHTLSQDQVRRSLEQRELIEPMRLMIGAPWARPGINLDKDLFAGRINEVRRLRAFVDELESQSLSESFGRVISRTGRIFTHKARLLMISARGGLGKSTLISKFVYDHAAKTQGLPFAYLDFDSAALHPKNPLLLLVEVARQVALFHPDHNERLVGFINAVRQSLLEVTAAPAIEHGSMPVEDEETEHSSTFYQQFRTLMQQLIYNSPAKSFLLVLDTLELVQSDPDAMIGLLQFLQGLTRGDFPQLAIVASGRSEVLELSELVDDWNANSLVLEPLDSNDAISMVQLLGEHLLKEEWQTHWARKIVGKKESAPREPLSLRICVEAVRNEKPESRESLVNQIAELGEACDSTSVDFVGRLYQKRILEHIADLDARRLAWPGLVARTISKTVACEVLAPECGLSGEQASRAFDRLKHEVWIVTQEGDDLRHRPDLRARTLPLMLRHDESMFKRICGLMSRYYLNKYPQGADELAEAAYYNLLADNSGVTRMLDAKDSGTLQRMLWQRVDDFGEGSLVAQDLKVRQASKLLPAEAFRKIPDQLAWRHVEQSGQALRELVDLRVDQRIVHLSHLLPWNSLRALTAAQQTILIKTGRWKELLNCRFVVPENQYDLQAVLFLANFLSSVSWLDSMWLEGVFRFIKTINPAKCSWLNLAYILLPSYRLSPELYQSVDWELFRAMPRNGVLKISWLPALKVAIAFGTESLEFAIQTMLKYRDVLSFFESGFSIAELDALRSGSMRKHSVSDQITNFFRRSPNSPEITEEVLNALKEALMSLESNRSSSDPIRQSLRRFALAGNADLAGPTGYLLTLSDNSFSSIKGRFGKSAKSVKRSDLIQVCRQAEQEGELYRLLEEALPLEKHPVVFDNLELLETIGSSWASGLNEYFKPHELP
jgi:hypothetical protein